MYRTIKIDKLNYDFSYSFDYKFAVIQSSKKNINELAKKLKNSFCNFQLINDWSGCYIKLYNSIYDTKKLIEQGA